MDNFSEHERTGREKLQKILSASNKIERYEFTPDKYARLDAFSTGVTGVKTSYEIKDRDIASTAYPDFILEEIKYNALKESYDKSGYTPYYVNFFNDGTCILWNINNIDITNRIETKYCTRTTAENYKKGETPKKVICLRPDEGYVIRYDK